MTRSERLALWRSATSFMAQRGWLPAAGGCGIWLVSGSLHPDAPVGASKCATCGRIVLRGEGRWWE